MAFKELTVEDIQKQMEVDREEHADLCRRVNGIDGRVKDLQFWVIFAVVLTLLNRVSLAYLETTLENRHNFVVVPEGSNLQLQT